MVATNTSATGRISLSSDGVQANGNSFFANVSGDGRWVVFESDAANLVAGDTSGFRDVFLRDTLTGLTRRISIDTDGTPGIGDSHSADVSDDGRFVVFSHNPVILGFGRVADVEMRDMHTGVLTTISVSSDEIAGNAPSTDGRISGDGRFVSFESRSTNLVADDTNAASDIFLRDTLKGTTVRVSVNSAEQQADGASREAEISSSGRFVVFTSDATNLVAGDTNAAADIFLRDMALGTTTRISVNSAEAQANAASLGAQISSDGRYVVFHSAAGNLVPGDTDFSNDVFLRDTVLGTTTLVSVPGGGVLPGGEATYGDVSDDGRFVVFEQTVFTFADGTTPSTGIFLRDMAEGTTICLSVGLGGVAANHSSFDPVISDDGRFVFFHSQASNLAFGDSNGASDVYRVSLRATDSGDWMVGSDGADTIDGLGGSDILTGAGGADTLLGSGGEDELQGGAGNDVLRGGAGADTLDGGADIDLVTYFGISTAVTVNLAAGTGSGGEAAGDRYVSIENVNGGTADDTIIGSGAGNVLDGGAGADVLTGGAGADRFVVASPGHSVVGTGADRITDFSHAQGDRIDLSQIDASTVAAGNQAFSFIGGGTYTGVAGQLRFAAAGGTTTIAGDVDGDRVSDFHIVLTGTVGLVAGDFVL